NFHSWFKMKKSASVEILHLIDIGNTSATYALAVNGRLSKVLSLPCDQIPQKVKICSKKGEKYRNIVLIASVVPKNTEKVTSELYARGISHIMEVGQDISVPLQHLYKNGKKLGIDRQIDAYGAIISN